jgi:hypothetical protein
MHDWKADLDQCSQCGSVRLVRRLGEAECRDCGYVITPEDGAVPGMRAAADAGSAGRTRAAADAGAAGGVAVPAGVAVGAGGVAALTGAGVGRDAEDPGLSSAEIPVLSGADAPGLSEEVARALDRVLGRGPVGR